MRLPTPTPTERPMPIDRYPDVHASAHLPPDLNVTPAAIAAFDALVHELHPDAVRVDITRLRRIAGWLADMPREQAHQEIDGAAIFLPALEAIGQAGARQLVVGGEAVALEAGVLAFDERRGGREHEQVRQEVARLVHEVDAQLVVVDAGVHVHAADDEAPADAGEVAGNGLVAGALGGLLRTPRRERMG